MNGFDIQRCGRKAECEIRESLYRVTVQQRDAAWQEIEQLREELTRRQSQAVKGKEFPTLLAALSEIVNDHTEHSGLQNLARECLTAIRGLLHERDQALADAGTLRHALSRISLSSQNSMGTKEECGRIARRALSKTPDTGYWEQRARAFELRVAELEGGRADE